MKDISFDFVPKNFRLKFDIETRLIFVRVKWNGIIEHKIIHDTAIPRVPKIDIPNFFGLRLTYGWTAQLVPLFIGVFNGTAGVDVALPDDAKWTLGYPKDPYSTGLEGAVVNTHFNVRQADGICKMVLANTPKINFELDFSRMGRLLTTMMLALPEYGIDASPRIGEYAEQIETAFANGINLDKNGACEKELGAGTAGISVNVVRDVTFNIISATIWKNKPREITDWRIYVS